jgi:hypothetical protein
MLKNQITAGLVLALIPFTTATTSDETTTHPDTTTPITTNSEIAKTATTTTLTLTAYEFPFCLSSDSDLLQDFFISRPTHTNLTITTPPSFSSPNGECFPINASKGIPHSFYYTVYDNNEDGSKRNSDFGSCELLTFEDESCGGEGTPYPLRMVEGDDDGASGRSKCFSKPDRFVKALLKSARISCAEWF